MGKQSSVTESGAPRLVRRLSPLAVWALSFGCSVGWGSFVMPGTTFLPIAGPLGTALGIAVGALVMLIIGVNYAYLMNRYPDAGGTFTFTKMVFGYDHGFLSAWFMGLVYLAIIWANATAIPLIFRNILGDLLHFGYFYTIAGYDVYLGEIMISLLAVLVFGFVCLKGSRAASMTQILLALFLIVGILVAFFAVFTGRKAGTGTMQPLFSPDYKPGAGILFIVFLAPWAYAGFESVSHATEEFRFPVKKSLRILMISLVTSALAYIALALIAAAAQPEGFGSWVEYFRGMESLNGVQGLPTFYAVSAAMGKPGIAIMGVAAAAGIITGLVGNMTAASRLIYSMARDNLLPAPMAALNKNGAPKNAILFLILACVPIPFLGRSAIGWIIDVNTIGVAIAYAYTSAVAFRQAWAEKKTAIVVSGAVGIGLSIFFLLYFLVPNLWSVSTLTMESYLMFMLWSVLGFVTFYLIFRRDKSRRMGKSTTIWIVLLLLIFFTSMIWIMGTTGQATEIAVEDAGRTYAHALESEGQRVTDTQLEDYKELMTNHFHRLTGQVIRNTVVQFLLFLVALLIVFRIYSTVQRQHQSAVEDKNLAEQSSQAKTNFLSNMSHDIRTPMNAIVGYVTLAKREKDLSPRSRDYLDKIEASSSHLLALINDVLEMSRIESGKMELMPVPTDLRKVMEEVRDMFSTQMETKGLNYVVSCEEVTDARVLCDGNRLNRVLLNLISNAYKFTPEGGSVTVTLRQTGMEDGKAAFRLSVKDTGIGMSPEFTAKVFEAYEREKTAAVENIQGTGLGTAITKRIVDIMGGSIRVFSEQGKGSEFVVDIAFPPDPEAVQTGASRAGETDASAAFSGVRLLLAEDDPDNRNVETALLQEAGFLVDTAENGEEAVEMLAASRPGYYALVLMDIEMPVKNGYNASKLIRSLKNPALASVPIVALTAKAFSEDIAAARAAGMNGHIAKPLNMKNAIDTLSELLGQDAGEG
ncbi:MAG: amino acid permease [Oscillospiraceae bacterium]|nr:amino acid permease [Oscillospiraceae bacterium]